MSGAGRYVVERRDSRRWAVIDTQGRTPVTRVVNEYSLRRQARAVADALNSPRPPRLPQVVRQP